MPVIDGSILAGICLLSIAMVLSVIIAFGCMAEDERNYREMLMEIGVLRDWKDRFEKTMRGQRGFHSVSVDEAKRSLAIRLDENTTAVQDAMMDIIINIQGDNIPIRFETVERVRTVRSMAHRR